jgi:hypothetical protein
VFIAGAGHEQIPHGVDDGSGERQRERGCGNEASSRV